MPKKRKARSPASLIVALALLLVCGMGGALYIVLGTDSDATEAAEVAAETDMGNPAAGETETTQQAGPGRRQVSSTGGADATVAATVRGRVRAYRSREPIVGLKLTLTMPPEAEGGKPVELVTESDAKGVFRFAGLPPRGGYALSGIRDPFAPVALPGIDLGPSEERDLGTIWLDVPVDLPVQVRGLNGMPIANAEVAVFATTGGAADTSETTSASRVAGLAVTPTPTAKATTDDSGDATVAGLLPGTYHVRATAPDRGTASQSRVLVAPDAAPHPVRLLLPKAHELKGTVHDADDKPVAEARVIATPNASSGRNMDKLEGPTKEDGSYVVGGLAPGIYTLYLAQAEKPLVRVGTARIPDQERVDLRLRATATLLGTVTSSSGEPVADAEVQYASQGGMPLVTRTGEDGTYLLEDVPAGASAYFRVRADGYVPFPDPTAPQQGTGESVREGAEIRRDIVLSAGVRVTVTVLAKADEHPIEGAVVSLRMAQMWGSGGQPWSATTDDNGVAEYPGIVPGTYLVVITAAGYVQDAMPPRPQNVMQSPAAMPAEWRITVSEDFTVTYHLAPGTSVSGVVRGPDGQPFPGARISVTGARSPTPVFSDAEGKFTIESVPTARRATASASAPELTTGTSAPFAVPAAEPVKDIEIKLAPGGSIKGRMRSSEGRPLEGAYVRYVRGKLNSRNPWGFRQFDRASKFPVAPDGSFEITGVTEGAVTVRGDCDGHLPAWDSDVKVTGAQSTGGVDLILTPGAEMKGRVEGPGGQPIVGATINANYTGDGKKRQWGFVAALPGAPTTQSDAEGRFAFRGLKLGNYNLSAGAPGVAPGWSQASTGTGDVVIKLGAAESISGVVKGPDGKPLAGVPVEAKNADQARNGRNNWWWGGNRVFTAPDGSFEFVNLAEGAYDLTVSANWLWGRDVNVKDKTETGVRTGRDDVEILVEAGTTIEGRVIDQGGSVVTTGWVTASSESGNNGRNMWGRNQRWSRLSSDGTFKISGLEPGPHTVSVSGTFIAEPAKGVATGTTDLELRVRAGFLIKGYLVDVSGLSIATGFNIQMRKKGTENWSWSQVFQPGDGGFIMVGLEDGAYDLKVQANPFAPMEIPNVIVGTEDLEIVLQQGREISGTIVNSNGSPVAANVQATQINVPAGATPSNGWSRANQTGKFAMQGLMDGEYRLYIRAGGYAPLIMEPVRGGSTDMRIIMEVGETVSGTVKYANGDPIANARLRLTDDFGLQVGYVRSQQDGSFVFNNIPAGGDWNLIGSVPVSGPNIAIKHSGKVMSGATDIEVVVEE